MREFVVVDVETTGLSPREDRIVEVAALRYVDGVETEMFCTLVNPGMPIPPRASAVHGIRDADVRDAPSHASIRERLAGYVGATPIAAHNAPFDRGFLPELAERDWLCTMRLARRLWPHAGGYRNAHLHRFLALPPSATRAHRAAADCRTTAAIAGRAFDELRRLGHGTEYAELVAFLRPLRGARRRSA